MRFHNMNRESGFTLIELLVVIRQMVLAYLPAEGGHDHGKLVSDHYRDYKTTDLKVTIHAGTNSPLAIVVK